MTIRPGTPADFDAIAALNIASWRATYKGMVRDEYLGQIIFDDVTGRWQDRVLGPRDILLVSEDAGQINGFCFVLGDREPAYIDNLHVDPGLKRSGIGAQLMRATAAALLEQGRDAVTLTVITDNLPAVRFYQKMGAETGPEEDNEFCGQTVQVFAMTWRDLAALKQA